MRTGGARDPGAMTSVVHVKHAAVDARQHRTPRTRRRSLVALAGVAALVLSACGGDDDDSGDSSSTTSTVVAPLTLATTTTLPAPTTTVATPTTPPPLELVTEGATVVVANASGIDGAAGRMTDALGAVGFTTGTATNSSEGQINTSKIYYDADNENAKAVADSLREALGGGDIEVLELTVPAPTETGEIGDASILVAMGNDIADKSLDELQGRVAGADDTSDDTGDETTSDEGTSDGG